MRRLVLTFLLGMVSMSLSASHIIGGFISYRHLGSHRYEVTLTVYRDCYYGIPNFDNPAYVGVYRANGQLYRTLSLADPIVTKLQPALQNPCVIIPPTICVQKGIYRDTLYLPPSSGGYDLVYQRCCRNRTILNIVQPNASGATYTAHVPGTSNVPGGNTSPVFKQFPPIAVCVGEPLVVDQSATDGDGDSLSYSLCTPFNGAQNGVAKPNPPAPPPFTPVVYANGYNALYPLPSFPPMQIDPVTGILTGHPTLQGQFVVGICITEYRKGKVIGTYLRDFQFNVITCQKMAAIAPVVDTLYCPPYKVQFDNRSRNATQFEWDFGDPTTTQDKSLFYEPSYTYPDTGEYQVRLIAKNQFGCVDTAYTTVIIRPGAEASFLFSPPCKRPDIVFTDLSAAYEGNVTSWHWDFGDSSTSTQQFPQHQYAQPGHYPVTLTIQTDSGCVVSTTRQVPYQPAPEAHIAAQDGCVGAYIPFEDSSTAHASKITYRKWRINGQTSINTKQLSRVFNQPGTYPARLLVINALGCQDSVTEWITVHPSPSLTIQGDSLLCEGATTTLLAQGAQQYQWLPGQHTGANVSVQPQQSTTYTVTGTDTNGCTAAAMHTLQVAPPLPLSVQHNAPVCAGDTVSLQAQTSGSVIWQHGGQVIGQGQRLDYPLLDTDTLIVAATSFLGCQVYDTIVLTPHPNPQLQLTPTHTTVCQGGNVALLASGGSHYQWQPAIDISCTSCPNPLITPSASRQYTVTAFNQYQCEARDSVAITFYPQQPITLSYDTTVCEGAPAQVAIQQVQSVQWHPASAFPCDTCLTTQGQFANTTLVKAQYVDVNGCPGDTAFPITVQPTPNLTVSPAQPYVCEGQSVNVMVSGAQHYQWTPHTALSCQKCPDPVITPRQSTTFQVSGTNSFGCTDSTAVTVAVKPLPHPDLMEDTTLCQGDSVQLVSKAGQNWNWSANHQSLRCPSCQATWVKPSVPTVVVVTINDQWGCQGIDSVAIDLWPRPDLQLSPPDTICPGDTASLSFNPQLANVALYPGRDLVALQNGTLHLLPAATTRYSFRGQDARGCTNTIRFEVPVAPLPMLDAGADQTVYPYQPFTLQGQSDGAAHQWHPGSYLANPTQLTTEGQVQHSTWFTLTTYSALGCLAMDSVFITVEEAPLLTLPNAFSPNGDGRNDLFTAELPRDFIIHRFQVFDRWGAMVADEIGTVSWDGRLNGEPLPAGVYIYRLRYSTPYGQQEQRQGNITLLR